MSAAATLSPRAHGLRLADGDTRRLNAAAARLDRLASQPPAPALAADGLARALERWRNRDDPRRRDATAAIAAASGHSRALLEESLEALLAPFTRAALDGMARRAPSRPPARPLGFVMPGNVPGAGLHEVCAALLCGRCLIVKTSSAEPFFFAAFAATLAETAPQLGARLEVFNWRGEDGALNAALARATGALVAYGTDLTLERLGALAAPIGFGARRSAAIVARGHLTAEVADALARDVTLFEQQGCLSPHQVFVEEAARGDARAFGAKLARALAELAHRLPAPRKLPLNCAAALRRTREAARWRALGGADVALWEGEALDWAVIHAGDVELEAAPGYRTVAVSPLRALGEIRARLEPFAGRLEAFALAIPEGRAAPIRRDLRALGASYLCAPGAMQSPPLEWRHGGGVFLDALGL